MECPYIQFHCNTTFDDIYEKSRFQSNARPFSDSLSIFPSAQIFRDNDQWILNKKGHGTYLASHFDYEPYPFSSSWNETDGDILVNVFTNCSSICLSNLQPTNFPSISPSGKPTFTFPTLYPSSVQTFRNILLCFLFIVNNRKYLVNK